MIHDYQDVVCNYQNHIKKTIYKTGQKFIKTYIVQYFLIVLLLNLHNFGNLPNSCYSMCFWSCVTYLSAQKKLFSIFPLTFWHSFISCQITTSYHYGYASRYEKAVDANGWHYRLIIFRKSLLFTLWLNNCKLKLRSNPLQKCNKR